MLSSCAVVRKPTSLSITVINYSKYSDDGFFITESNSVSFDYKAIGSLISSYQSGFEVKKNESVGTPKKTKWYDDPVEVPKTTNVFIGATPEKAVDELVRKAKEIGANGVINLKVDLVTSSPVGSPYYSYQATGMAIKK